MFVSAIPSSWTASEEENGGEAPDTPLITFEVEEAVPASENFQPSVTS